MPNETPTSDPSEPKKFADMKDTFWVWSVERIGIPSLVVVAGMYAIDKTAGWIAPRIDKVTDKHLEFMDKTETLQRESIDIQKQNLNIHKDQATILSRVTTAQENGLVITDEHRRLTMEIRDDVKDIKRAVVEPKPRATPVDLD